MFERRFVTGYSLDMLSLEGLAILLKHYTCTYKTCNTCRHKLCPSLYILFQTIKRKVINKTFQQRGSVNKAHLVTQPNLLITPLN